jgi:hypothetical protein
MQPKFATPIGIGKSSIAPAIPFAVLLKESGCSTPKSHALAPDCQDL